MFILLKVNIKLYCICITYMCVLLCDKLSKMSSVMVFSIYIGQENKTTRVIIVLSFTKRLHYNFVLMHLLYTKYHLFPLKRGTNSMNTTESNLEVVSIISNIKTFINIPKVSSLCLKNTLTFLVDPLYFLLNHVNIQNVRQYCKSNSTQFKYQ